MKTSKKYSKCSEVIDGGCCVSFRGQRDEQDSSGLKWLTKLQGLHYGQRHGGSGSGSLGGGQKDSGAVGQCVDDRIEQNDKGHKEEVQGGGVVWGNLK